ncbi:glycoside hydrolase family 5 protein [Rhizobium sp. 18055]|uniref:glycoside hydrolase family 5 protein n=1 Tax=Rhizobium sp. 18055 TaxID=2681403 RepID=UPI0013587191|nr:glycoside hydrolase family 5 protein [Rhizobium sp. 18055]
MTYMSSSWRRLAAAALATVVLQTGVANAQGTCLQGINLSGAEFGDPGGEYFKAYDYPSEETIAYFAGKGFNTVRLPFLWERLQPQLGKPLDEAEVKRLKDTVDLLRKQHLTIVLDPHNYASYNKTKIGNAPVTDTAFAEFWARLAVEFANQEDVIFGLMNEPNDIATDVWLKAANAAIRTIRATGANNLILVPGTKWTGAHSWETDGPGGANGTVMLGIRDPRKNYAFEVHQYFDDDSSGTNSECTGNDKALDAVTAMTAWARKNNTRVFLGEFGVSQDKACVAGLSHVLNHLQANPDVWLGWTYWVAGDWWPESETLNVQPHGGKDRKQMTALEKALKAPPPKKSTCKTLVD